MAIEFKADAKYAALVPTSMGIRLTPPDGQPFHCADTFKLQVTSAETNVVSIISYLGLPVKVLNAARASRTIAQAKSAAFSTPNILIWTASSARKA